MHPATSNRAIFAPALLESLFSAFFDSKPIHDLSEPFGGHSTHGLKGLSLQETIVFTTDMGSCGFSLKFEAGTMKRSPVKTSSVVANCTDKMWQTCRAVYTSLEVAQKPSSRSPPLSGQRLRKRLKSSYDYNTAARAHGEESWNIHETLVMVNHGAILEGLGNWDTFRISPENPWKIQEKSTTGANTMVILPPNCSERLATGRPASTLQVGSRGWMMKKWAPRARFE